LSRHTFAVISDIHANIHALEAVLADIDAQPDIDEIICLGDLVGYGAYPNQVCDAIRGRNIPSVMGNYDDGVGFERDDCGCAYKVEEDRRRGDQSLAWTIAHTNADNKAHLRTLAPWLRREVDGVRILLVHGSPRKINEYLYEDRPDSSFERIARGADADVILFGHTHLPYQKTVAGTLFVNVGSVGKPKDGNPRAGYALLSVQDGHVGVEIRRVAYDVEAAAAAIRAADGLPDHFATLLESASG
jgi:putative phosphoesterase